MQPHIPQHWSTKIGKNISYFNMALQITMDHMAMQINLWVITDQKNPGMFTK